jgi:hypothetical protein
MKGFVGPTKRFLASAEDVVKTAEGSVASAQAFVASLVANVESSEDFGAIAEAMDPAARANVAT